MDGGRGSLRGERGGNVRLVLDPVDRVQFVGQRQAGAAGDEEVGACGAPEGFRFQQPVGELGLEQGRSGDGPAAQRRVVTRLGQNVQHRGQFPQR